MRFRGSGFRVQGLGLSVSRFRGLEDFRVPGLGVQDVQGLGFVGFKLGLWSLEFSVWGLLRAFRLGVGVWGFWG